MAYAGFREFLEKLEREGELKRIKTPVDPVLEITEIADRVVKQGGPALLFENPKGSSIPLAIGVFATRKRMSMALGVGDIEEIAKEIDEWTKTPARCPMAFSPKRRFCRRSGSWQRTPPRAS